MSHDLGTIIAALHDSEINGEVAWFYDGVWHVKLGDGANGFVDEAVVASPSEAAEWLRANAVRHYPASRFAMLFPRSANDPRARRRGDARAPEAMTPPQVPPVIPTRRRKPFDAPDWAIDASTSWRVGLLAALGTPTPT